MNMNVVLVGENIRPNRKGIYKKGELFFGVAWILFASTLILNSAIFYVNNNTLELVFRIVRYLAYAICLINFFSGGVKTNSIPFLLVILAAFAISGMGTGNLTYPLYGIILLGVYGVNSDRVIKLTAWLQAFYLVTIVLLSQLGVIQDFIFDPNTRARHGLGFSWTTTGPMIFFYLCLCIIYLKRNRIKLITLLILEIINIWFFYMTDSKMAFGLLTVVLLFFTFQKKNKKRWKWLSKFSKLYVCMPFVMLAFTLWIVRAYNWYKPLWSALDKFLSYRLGLMQNAYNTYGLRLLGQPIHWIGFDYKATLSKATEAYNYVDNSYLQLGFNNGLVFLFTVLVLYTYGIYKAQKRQDYYLVFLYIIILALSFTEPRLMNFAYNPFPLIALSELANNMESWMQKSDRGKWRS